MVLETLFLQIIVVCSQSCHNWMKDRGLVFEVKKS